jgi:DNA-directed RNA polymerase subunit alpha
MKKVSEDAKNGVFEIDGLYAGYGLTVGNALRRALLSSLPGAAVTMIKVKGVPHEFTTMSGVKEDMVEVSMNFKKLRFKCHSEEPVMLTLDVKGEAVITGEDIEMPSDVELLNPEEVLMTVTDKKAHIEMEIKVERGLGYWPVEKRESEKLPVGAIALDAAFSPVQKVNYTVENMRVGDRTDYNRVKLEIETDGTISPSAALHKASKILKDHFEKSAEVEVVEFDVASKKGGKKSK